MRGTTVFIMNCFAFAVGCDGEFNEPQSVRVHSAPESIDFNVVYGVADPVAPNSILREWIRPRNAEPTGEISIEALDTLLKDVQTLDAHTIRIGEPERTQIQNSQSLRWLWLGESTTAEDLKWIASLRQLRGLSLRNARLQNADLSVLSALTELQWLDVSSAGITALEFSTLPELPHLQTFHADEVADDAWIPVLSRLPSLKSLILEHAAITDRGIRDLVELHPNLQSLDLYMVRKITEKSVEELLKLKNLKFLAIGLSGICPDVMDNANLRALQRGLPQCRIDYGD